MSVTQEQIEKLSRNLCKLSPEAASKLLKDVNSTLDYMEMLNEVDTTWVKPTVSVIEKKNVYRKDKIWENKTDPKELLSCSNQKVVANQIALTSIMN